MGYRRKPAGSPQDIQSLVNLMNPGPNPPAFNPPPAPLPAGEAPMAEPPMPAAPGGASPWAAMAGMAAAGGRMAAPVAAGLLIPQTMGPEWPQGQPSPHWMPALEPGSSGAPMPFTPPPAVPRGTYRKRSGNRYEDPNWVEDHMGEPGTTVSSPEGTAPKPVDDTTLAPGKVYQKRTLSPAAGNPDSPQGARFYQKMLKNLQMGTE